MPQKCSIGFSAKQPFGGEKTMNKKITATILSVMFIMGLAVGVVPVRTAAFDIPTTPTDGIQNGTYLIQDYVCNRYFGFTTGQPICDRSPSMQNSEWSIGYAGNGKYSISYTNSRVYGFLNNSNGTVCVAPNQQYWYIIKNSDGTYTFVPENDTSKALTTEIITAIDQINVRAASSSSTGGTQKWNLFKMEHLINVEAYYDAGFKIRYGNNSSGTSNYRIFQIVEQSKKLFSELFGLYHINTANGYAQSYCDICKGTVTSNNFNTRCSHVSSYTAAGNHTYWHNVIERFTTMGRLPSTYDKKRVLFVGNQTYLENGNASGLSASYPPTHGADVQGYMAIMKIYSDTYYDSRQGMIYAHELAHQYNAPDHYCSLYKDANGKEKCRNAAYCSHPEHTSDSGNKQCRSEYCIMDNIGGEGGTQYYHNGSLNAWSSYYDVFCSYCKADIEAAINQLYN